MHCSKVVNVSELIGSSNTSEVMVHGLPAVALVDSGSMVSTVAVSFYQSLPDKPPLQELSTLGVDINVAVANGSSLHILGYIEVVVAVPSLDFELPVPVLVVPDTAGSQSCPVILGTNVIRRCRSAVSAATFVCPEPWQLAFDTLVCNPVSVKSTNEHTIEVAPYDSITLHGIARGLSSSVSKVVTEGFDSESPCMVRPHVVSVQQGSYAKIPVRLCNMTAKPFFIKPKSEICVVNEIKVVDDLSSSSASQNVSAPSSSSSDPIADLGIKIDTDNLSSEQILRVRQVLGSWGHIFSTGPTDLGCSNLVKHKIVLTNDAPFKQPYRKIPPAMYDEVRQHLKEMLECGAIRESDSPFSSNVVLVRKKDGSLRFCLDFRMLNSRTRKDAYMLPRFDDTVDTLVGSKFFSKLDLRSGYWQVEMEEEDKAKTAFSVGNLGFYECNRMPFGLTNSGATFQRLMEKCMGDLNLKECLVFIDDILIFSSTFEEHLSRLESVFKRLETHGLKLKGSKCEFFKSSVTYLGHVMSESGISTDPDKTSAISDWPVPCNVSVLRSFLGTSGFYRRFVSQVCGGLFQDCPTSQPSVGGPWHNTQEERTL